MEDSKIDQDLLAKHLRNEMDKKQLSLRAAAGEIGCSPATLARLLQGAAAPNLPDSINLMRAASWLKKSIADFEKGRIKPSVNLTDVEVHLRALPGLSKTDAEALVAMVKAAYGAARELRTKKS